jgi:hypothetical protein
MHGMDFSDPNSSDTAAAIAFSREVAAAWMGRNEAQVLGVYLIGSLAHGGFSRRYSDIDLALILDEADAAAVRHMRSDARALPSEFAGQLSLFWTNRDFSTGRFPPLDRIDYLDYGIPLEQRERVVPSRPSLAEIRAYLGGAPLSKWASEVRRFALLKTLAPADNKRYLRALLYPARFCFSWVTGRIASNDSAVAFLSEWPRSRELSVSLIQQALERRCSDGNPGALFSQRATLMQLVLFCERLVAASR